MIQLFLLLRGQRLSEKYEMIRPTAKNKRERELLDESIIEIMLCSNLPQQVFTLSGISRWGHIRRSLMERFNANSIANAIISGL